uniref:Uncharacterized protein n=1 Tax=Anguilla anguilla TaxID=7936 RepID=A0A0E9XFU4_ANGAN
MLFINFGKHVRHMVTLCREAIQVLVHVNSITQRGRPGFKHRSSIYSKGLNTKRKKVVCVKH